MASSNPNSLFYILVAVAGLVLGAVFFAKIQRKYVCWRMRRRQRRGLRLEGRGIELLKKHGYTILAVQENLDLFLIHNSKKRPYNVRPDAMVSKKGRIYLAEIKTGTTATDPLFRETRRQLMEYYFGFGAQAVLLVDADRGVIDEIAFRQHQPVLRMHAFRRFLWGFILGFLIGLLVLNIKI